MERMNASTPLEELADRESIRDVLARYCRGIDRLDEDLLRSVYHPDAIDDHGGYVGGVDGFVEWAFSKMAGREYGQHSLGTVIIDLDGDVAFTESYFTSSSVARQKGDSPRMLSVLSGRFVDRFERRDGIWRIARRIVVKDLRQQSPLNDIQEPLQQSRDGRDDWAYRIRVSAPR
jgi:hypothetical protein